MKRVHVVAAVIYEPQNRVINNAEAGVVERILISCRPTHVHKGGFWEFPGGKLEIDEDARAGLVRELYEELDIEVTEATPFMQISHDYPDKKVFLDVWIVSSFTGQERGAEGQRISWVALNEISNYTFPEANQSILDKLLNSLR